MPSVKVGISIPTPCGGITVYKVINLPFSFPPDFSFFINFPPKFHIPWPDCSWLCRANSAPEPASDSKP